MRDANARVRVLVKPAEFASSARVLQWAAWADSGRHVRANRCANAVRSCAKFSPQMFRPHMLEHKLYRGTEAARCIQQQKSQNWPRARGPINLFQFARKIFSAL